MEYLLGAKQYAGQKWQQNQNRQTWSLLSLTLSIPFTPLSMFAPVQTGRAQTFQGDYDFCITTLETSK